MTILHITARADWLATAIDTELDPEQRIALELCLPVLDKLARHAEAGSH